MQHTVSWTDRVFYASNNARFPFLWRSKCVPAKDLPDNPARLEAGPAQKGTKTQGGGGASEVRCGKIYGCSHGHVLDTPHSNVVPLEVVFFADINSSLVAHVFFLTPVVLRPSPVPYHTLDFHRRRLQTRTLSLFHRAYNRD